MRDSEIPPIARVIVDEYNSHSTLERWQRYVFAFGISCAVLSSLTRWPLYLPMCSSLLLFGWVASLIVYAELYKDPSRTFQEAVSRLRYGNRAAKCVFLFLLPAVLRLLRMGVIIILNRIHV